MSTIINIISWIFQIYEFLILIRVLLAWINVNPFRPTIDHSVVRLLCRIIDPVLEPLRRIVPPIGGAIDITPIVALLLLELLRQVIIRALLAL